MSTSSILRALSALAPSAQRAPVLDPGDLLWLGMTPARAGIPRDPFAVPFPALLGSDATLSAVPLAAVDVVGTDGTVLGGSSQMLGDVAARATLDGATTVPVSWMTAVGRAPDAEPDSPPFVLPVLHTRARLLRRRLDIGHLVQTSDRAWTLERSSDWVLGVEGIGDGDSMRLLETLPWCGLVGYPAASDALLAQSPTLRAWIRTVAAAAGWRVHRITGRHPLDAASRFDGRPGDVAVCVGFSVLPTFERRATGAGAALAAWADREGIDETAFAALVDATGPDPTRTGPASGGSAADEVVSHVPLTPAQRRVAASARTEPVTVVSGAPGTGKSHTIAAICADAVARGDSVLVATRTVEAASVIAELLARQPGPVPLRFGSPEATRDAFGEIERRLAEQQTPGTALRDEADEAFAAVQADATRLLADLRSIDLATAGTESLAAARRRVARVFAPGADLTTVRSLLVEADDAQGWFGTSIGRDRRRRRSAQRLAELTDAPSATPADRAVIADAVAIASALHTSDRAPELAASLEQSWPAFEEAEARRRYWTGRALDHLTLERLGSRAARAALGTIDTALRSGASSRQRLLSTLDRSAFTAAAPVWLGTLGEIERLLPPTAAWFDVIVIDEASQADLTLAAPALLRGVRCVVLGDPRQLRPVSFVSDDAVSEAFDDEGLGGDIGRLDVRRNSVYDLAARVAPVTWLDEHHRSLPHLVQFSLDEFYDRAVALATRYPTSEERDCIDVLDPRGDPVRTVVQRLRELHRASAHDVGVVTPLRELADQLREAVLVELGPDVIDAMHLMVTTVHGFQGAERRHVIVVPGIDAQSSPGRRRFVEDRHLFNVMVSRAREHMDVVTDVGPDDRSLLGRFVAWSHHAPTAARGEAPSYRSAVELGRALSDAGLDVRYRYPVGSHHVDVVVRRGERVAGIMCGVHTDGPAAHIERHLALRRVGWRLVDLVPALDDTAIAARAIEIAGDLA